MNPSLPRSRRFGLSSLLATLCLTASTAQALDAPPGLVPPGLQPGDQFYVMFVTSVETPATSGDLATYQAFVDARKNASTLPGVRHLAWRVLGAATNAGPNNPQCQPFFDGPTLALNHPVYTTTGALIKATAAGMYAGGATILDHAIDIDESGTQLTDTDEDDVWTGCDANGAVRAALGLSEVTEGEWTATNFEWTDDTSTDDNTDSNYLYAVSPLLTVGFGPAWNNDFQFLRRPGH